MSMTHEQVIDITEDVGATTCALTIHDAADHVRAHVLSALVGPSVSIPVRDGRLGLGRFQRIVLLEFEGPRARSIEVSGPWI
jgi:thiamine phosphate synthase YjbQ (UPF0047 family)